MWSAGEARVLERLDRAGDVHRLAEAGVGVDDRRQLGHPGDLLPAAGDLGERRQADVGQPEVGARARHPRCRRPRSPSRSMSLALSGLNAPGNRSSSPEARRSRNSRRFSAAGVCGVQHQKSPFCRSRSAQRVSRPSRHTGLDTPLRGYSTCGCPSEESLGDVDAHEHARRDDREADELVGAELGQALREVEEPLDLGLPRAPARRASGTCGCSPRGRTAGRPAGARRRRRSRRRSRRRR